MEEALAPIEPAPAKESLVTEATLVACNPQEMAVAQEGMIAWACRMQEKVKEEIVELEAALEIATRNGWGTRKALQNQLNRAAKRIIFYEKIEHALREGYLVVPNFDMDIFAIRTKAHVPRGQWKQWGNNPANYRQPAAMLPAGEGKLVSPLPTLEHIDTGTAEKPRHEYRPIEWEDVDFPLEMAKPVVMGVTARALRLKLFDSIGIARNAGVGRRGDPMILGRFHNPRTGRPDVTFFIAWLLDPSNI